MKPHREVKLNICAFRLIGAEDDPVNFMFMAFLVLVVEILNQRLVIKYA